MSTPQPDPLSYIPDWCRRFLEGGWWHSFELPDGTVIRGVSDLAAQQMRIGQFPIPADLSGMRVLDIGAWDGWFSFEMERRGAEVLAIDRFDNPRFHEIRARLGSRVEYRQMDVYDIGPRAIGSFDIVLFMGVFYHLKHPLLALERVCSVTRGMAAVESFVLTQRHGLSAEQEQGNLLQFFEDDDFGGIVDNWFAPTPASLMAICRTAGFARAEFTHQHDYGAAITCYRQWGGIPGEEAGVHPAANLLAAVHTDNYGINFNSTRDEYVTCLVSGPGLELSRQTVFPEVSGYGARPVLVEPQASGDWRVHFKLPPGLSPGWHPVRLRMAGQAPTNEQRVAVDLKTEASFLEIGGACDGVTWQPGEVSLAGGFLSLWVVGLPENADRHNVRAEVDGRQQLVHFTGAADANGVRQVNVRLSSCTPGKHPVRVSFGEVFSPPVDVNFIT